MRIVRPSFFKKLQLLLGMMIMLSFLSPTITAATPEFEVLQSLGKREGNPSGKLTLDANGNFYGTTLYGGSYGFGAIYKIDTSGSYSVLYSFDGIDGSPANLILGSDGNFYGTTSVGGSFNSGTVFKIDISGIKPTYSLIYAFGGSGSAGGINPSPGLIQGADGKFYGTTTKGGSFNAGILYKLDLSGSTPTYAVLHEFENAGPLGGTTFTYSNLTEGSDGKLYGTRYANSGNIAGTAYQIDKSGTSPVYKALQGFSGALGILSELIQGDDGKLYGTAYGAPDRGNAVAGWIYQLDISGTAPVITYLHAFLPERDRDRPKTGVIKGKDGKFYGTTAGDGKLKFGTIFQLDTSGAVPVYTILHEFNGKDGVAPGALTQGIDGKIYGTTSGGGSGGSGGSGTVFQLDLSGSTPIHTVLYAFNSPTGGNPTGLIQGNNGKLYGTVFYFSQYTNGNVFQLDITGPSPTVTDIFVLDYTDNSYYRTSEVIQGKDGKFYGTTGDGGSTGLGTFFQFDISGLKPVYKVLHEFDRVTGYSPGPIIQGSDGKFYGNTNSGGSFGHGTMFQLDASAVTPIYNVLHEFNESLNTSILVQGKDGKFYGYTQPFISVNGDRFLGTVFQLDVSGASPVYTTVYTFLDNQDLNDLIQGQDGKFYGTSYYLGDCSSNPGKIFQLDFSGSTPSYSVVYQFDQANACPRTLLQGRDGKFYGTTIQSFFNDTGNGNIFQLDTSGSAPIFTVLHSFIGADGKSPSGALVQASDGNIYGTTAYGGQYGEGVIYRIKLDAPPANTPPVAANDSFVLTVKGKKPVTVAAPGVLGNDKDAEGNALTVFGATATTPRAIDLPKHGGKVALYADGHFVYKPAKGCIHGSHSFAYQVSDGKETGSATVTLTLRCKNSDH